MARIIAGVASSHVPAIGAAIDNKQTEEPYWKRVFAGFENSKEWMAETKPDVVILVYNDHASAFSVEIDPDLRDRLRGGVSARRRRLGPAPGAGGEGPSGARLAHRAVGDPRRVRPHHRQQDGRRPRPDRAAEPDVRLAEANGRARSSRSRSTWCSIRRRPAIAASCSARRSARRSESYPEDLRRRDLRHRRHDAPDLRARAPA